MMTSESRHIDLEGPRNTRDLGGMTTVDGKEIKPKRLIRSGALYRASESDVRTLVDDYEVRTIVDLRTDQEREAKPDPIEEFNGTRFIDLAIFNTEALGITRDNPEFMKKMAKEISHDPVKIMVDIYPKMMLDPRSLQGFATFFDILLEENEGSILWHCSAGKDRVGMATFLLLNVLGVPRKTAVDDYLATNRYMEGNTQEVLSAFAAFKLPDQVRQSIQVLNSADERFLQAALDGIDEQWGSLDRYLSDALGLTSEKTEALQHRFLEILS